MSVCSSASHEGAVQPHCFPLPGFELLFQTQHWNPHLLPASHSLSVSLSLVCLYFYIYTLRKTLAPFNILSRIPTTLSPLDTWWENCNPPTDCSYVHSKLRKKTWGTKTNVAKQRDCHLLGIRSCCVC